MSDADFPLKADLDAVLERTRPLWEEARGGRFFLTGGTGFFGRWLLDSLLWANRRLGLRLSCAVLTRDPAPFRLLEPRLAGDAALRLLAGDVRSFAFPPGSFTHLVHAAAPASYALAKADPALAVDTIVHGMRRVLDFAAAAGKPILLNISSGAVYGDQPAGVSHLGEDHPAASNPSEPASPYTEGKRTAEALCAAYAPEAGLKVRLARPFSFVGPRMPLDREFAVGNFVRDALSGGPIRISGDGTPVRAYLYAADLAVWLWTILFRGQDLRPYNVGSEEAVTLADLARLVAETLAPKARVTTAQTPIPGAEPHRYVPSTRRAREELGLRQWTPLPEGLLRAARWRRT